MTYDELIRNIQNDISEYEAIPPTASEEQITSLKNNFKNEFSYELPEIYCNILRLSNGINYNGLTIWPSNVYDDFKESLVDANKDFHDVVSEDYLYFAQWDEIVFVLEIITKTFKALDLKGMATWKTFKTCDEMLKFALECAYNNEEDET